MANVWENPIFVRARSVEDRTYGAGLKGMLRRYGGAQWLLLAPLAAVILGTGRDLFTHSLGWLQSGLVPVLGFSAFMLVLYASSRALAGTCSAITQEREQKTFDSLRSTLMSESDLVLGKLAAGLWPITRELLGALPVALVLGAVADCLPHAVAFSILCFSCVLFFGLLGLTCSFLSASTARATRLANSLVAGVVLGGPALDWLWFSLRIAGGDSEARFQPMTTLLSPLVAAGSLNWGWGCMWMSTVGLYALLSLAMLALNCRLARLLARA